MQEKNKPVYMQIADMIREQIETGEIKPGDKLMSENEMTKAYGVARLTVREALGVLVNEGFLEKKHGKGTFCKMSRRGLSIDVLLDMNDFYFIPYYVRSISAVLDKNGADFIVGDTKNSWDEIIKLLKKIIKRGSDGIIVQVSPQKDFDRGEIKKIYDEVHEAGIPLLQIDTKSGIDGVPLLIMDEEKIGKLAAKCFIEHGHKKMAYIARDNCNISDMRMKYFKESFPDARRIDFDGKLSESIRSAYDDGITGIFCFNDFVAKSCIDAMNSIGLRMPEDISLVGVDDTLLSKVYNLTSVTHAKEEIGECAAKMIVEGRLENVVFEPELAERTSVKDIL